MIEQIDVTKAIAMDLNAPTIEDHMIGDGGKVMNRKE